MNAPKTGSQSKLQATYQEIRKDKEQIEMRMTSNISKVKTWVSRSLATHRSIKLLGVVALGALMITVTGLQFAPNQAEESERIAHEVVLIPGAPAALAGFTPNQQVEILGGMDDDGVDGSVSDNGDFADEYDEELFDPNWTPQVLSPQPVLIPGAPAALAGFTPNQQVMILGEMDDDGVDGSVSDNGDFADEYDEELFDPNWMPQVLSPQPVLIPGAPAALAGFTPNQQVEILGEMDDDGVDGSVSNSGDFADEYDEELFDPNWTPQALSPQPVLIPGAPAGLAGFTPNQQVEILGEMDDF